MKILFVCTGNSCRSPMAEGLMKKLAKERSLNIECASCGLFPDADRASINAVLAMEEYGVDIKTHIPSAITVDVIKEADVILTMTRQHKQIIEGIEEAQGKVFTLNEYAGDETGAVLDPYGGNLDEYKKCASLILGLLERVCEKIEGEE